MVDVVEELDAGRAHRLADRDAPGGAVAMRVAGGQGTTSNGSLPCRW
jgi:hypothetical protein